MYHIREIIIVVQLKKFILEGNPSGNLQKAWYCASTGGTKQYWRSTVNYAYGVVLAEPWHDNAIQY